MFDFFIQEILGMQWLSRFIWDILLSFNADKSSHIWGSIHFFLYDTIKIGVLLVTLIFMISYIQSYFPPARTRRILTKFRGVKGAAIAALLGTVTPFCSCSSIPIFIGFTRAGLPLGMTLSFLISSPMVDVASMLMLMSFFGTNFALAYVIVGLVLAVSGGLLIEKLGMEKHIITYTSPIREFYWESEYFNQKQRIDYACNDTKIIVKNVFPYVLVGVGIGAFLHNWVPQELIFSILGGNSISGVILATILGAPIYADIFGALPIAEALYLANVSPGTILSLMMSITTLSLPSLVLLSKVMSKKLLFTFIGTVLMGIIFIGYLFNIIKYL